MKNGFGLVLGSSVALIATSFLYNPAQAAGTDLTWVASTGSDSAACTRAAPCATFAGALLKTAPSGAISCVDSGSYGPVVIKQAVKIDCVGVNAEISAPSGVGVTISAAATDGVLITGLSIQGVLTGAAGIKITSGGNIGIYKTRVDGFKVGTGILIAPVAAAVNVKMQDTVIVKNATGVFLSTASAGAGRATLVGIDDSNISANYSYGLRLSSTNALTGVTTDQTTITSNNVGVSIEGPASGVTFRNSKVQVNGTGIATSGGAVAQSTGNNLISLNTTAGVTPTIIPQE